MTRDDRGCVMMMNKGYERVCVLVGYVIGNSVCVSGAHQVARVRPHCMLVLGC